MNANEIQQHVQNALAAQAQEMETYINNAIARGLASAAKESAALQAAYPKNEPKLDLPPYFDGNPKQLRTWLRQFESYLSLKPASHPTDATRVAVMCSRLSGIAAAWWSIAFDAKETFLTSVDLFKTAISIRFPDPNMAHTAAERLDVFVQGKLSVAAYTSQFRELLADSGWGTGAVANHKFRKGLRPDIQDLLMTFAQTDDLDKLASQANECENRILARHGQPTHTAPPPPSSSEKPVPMDISAIIAAVRMEMSAQPLTRSAPRGPLTAAERQRRFDQGLCLYCGGTGHVAEACPVLARRKQREASGNVPRRG
jgi:hypothetical protein